MKKYVGFSPPASASGPFPTDLSPPHCIFPNMKLLPEIYGQITHVIRVYTANNVERHDELWQFINSTHLICTAQHSKNIPVLTWYLLLLLQCGQICERMNLEWCLWVQALPWHPPWWTFSLCLSDHMQILFLEKQKHLLLIIIVSYLQKQPNRYKRGQYM